jgi:hypothetical protein
MRRFNFHFWCAFLMCGLLLFSTGELCAEQSQWVRPSKPGDPLTWGRRDGLVFGLISNGGMRGPRGLIRIGVYADHDSQPQLLNFVAVEPVATGAGPRPDRMAFSEMEQSTLDPGQRGKRMWAHLNSAGTQPDSAGRLETMHRGTKTIERLSVRIDIERFSANGAHV